MTTTLSPIMVERLRMQGFTVDELCLADASLGLRVAPALCAVVAAIGTATASPTILIALTGIALLGAMMPFHPFDLIYNYGIRFWLGKRRLPPNGVPRRLGCAIATVWLAATALLFFTGQAQIGYVLGALFVAVAGLLTATHICIPSLMYHFARQSLGSKSSPI